MTETLLWRPGPHRGVSQPETRDLPTTVPTQRCREKAWMCTRNYSNTGTVMSLAVCAPTQFVSAVPCFCLCAQTVEFLYFNQCLLMRCKQWARQLQVKPFLYQLIGFCNHLMLCICEGFLLFSSSIYINQNPGSVCSFVRCNHLFCFVAASSLCIHDNCILCHQYCNLLEAWKHLLFASHDRFCDVMNVTSPKCRCLSDSV